MKNDKIKQIFELCELGFMIVLSILLIPLALPFVIIGFIANKIIKKIKGE